MIGSSIVAGRSDRIFATASRTSASARSIGTPRSNSTVVTELPSPIAELSSSIPGSAEIASSTSRVTLISISVGATPGSVIVSETSGTSMVGKKVMGRV
jgi:hypothetical protein